MSADATLHALIGATRALVAAVPEIAAFTGPALDRLTYIRPTPRALSVTTRIAALYACTTPATAALTRAIADAAPHLAWQQSYDEAEVGAHYLANYGWFNLVSPDGPFHSDTIRVSVGYWEQGLTYPQHAHAPAEIYCVLAGGARFTSADRAPVEALAGALIHHTPMQWHGFSMHSEPLLALSIWKGAGLLAKSTLTRETPPQSA